MQHSDATMYLRFCGITALLRNRSQNVATAGLIKTADDGTKKDNTTRTLQDSLSPGLAGDQGKELELNRRPQCVAPVLSAIQERECRAHVKYKNQDLR